MRPNPRKPTSIQRGSASTTSPIGPGTGGRREGRARPAAAPGRGGRARSGPALDARTGADAVGRRAATGVAPCRRVRGVARERWGRRAVSTRRTRRGRRATDGRAAAVLPADGAAAGAAVVRAGAPAVAGAREAAGVARAGVGRGGVLTAGGRAAGGAGAAAA